MHLLVRGEQLDGVLAEMNSELVNLLSFCL